MLLRSSKVTLDSSQHLLQGFISTVNKYKVQDAKPLITNLHKAEEANFKVFDQNKPLSGERAGLLPCKSQVHLALQVQGCISM